jgi:hypothetical protein
MIYPNATFYIISAEDLERREGPAATIFMTIGFFVTLGYFCRVIGKRMGIKPKM